MTRGYIIQLNTTEDRRKASVALSRAPDGYLVTFKAPKRSVLQNDRMWAMLTDVSEQVEYYGKKRTPEAWKDIFSAALRQAETVPSLDGAGIVQIGLRTSQLSISQMSDLMELISAYGAEQGVLFREPIEGNENDRKNNDQAAPDSEVRSAQ